MVEFPIIEAEKIWSSHASEPTLSPFGDVHKHHVVVRFNPQEECMIIFLLFVRQ